MAIDFKIITGANLFCDEDPGESNHLQLDQVAIPDLARTMDTSDGAGTFMQVEHDMDLIEALVLPFTLKGISPGMIARVGLGDGKLHNYTVFKKVRDVGTNTQRRLTCVVKGVMASTKQDPYNKRGLTGFDFEIRGIQSYLLQLGNVKIFDFDWKASRRIVNNVNQQAESNAILGIE